MGDGPMIPVLWWDSHIACWDQAMVDAVVTGRSWATGYEFEHHVHVRIGDFTDGSRPAPSDRDLLASGAIVVIPARHHADEIDDINQVLSGMEWCLVILTSDEERVFPVEKLDHPNMAIWVQTPHDTDQVDWILPVGWAPQVPRLLAGMERPTKEGWFFAGQVNHPRRKACVDVLRELGNGRLVETPGFTQGLEHAEYAAGLAGSRVVPCPAGPETVDTFRVWEALEAGAVPVVDQIAGRAGEQGWYWPLVAAGAPFPQITDWSTFPAVLAEVERDWPRLANRCSAWWQDWKRDLAGRVSDAVRGLSGVAPASGDVTVLIPTSPIGAHPDTALIEQTVASVRHWLPDAEILVMCDGVRPEQEHYRARYEEYLHRLLWLTGTKWDRVLPVIHDGHLHQVEMTRRVLDSVRTPLVLFAEHDCPLVTDEHIELPALVAACLSGEADLIRLHHEALVLPDHEHLMLDREPRDVAGAPLLRTVQWSQRPHLASLAFYRRFLAEDFPEGYTGMVEDRMHGVVESAWRDYALAGWHRYRLWMYSPPGPAGIKRSYTLDGRGADEKWIDS